MNTNNQSTPSENAATKPASVADIEVCYRKLVADKIQSGLKKNTAAKVAIAQIESDASCGTLDPSAVEQWLQVNAKRNEIATLGGK